MMERGDRVVAEQIESPEELSLPVVNQDEVLLERIVLIAKALSDPIRIRMMNLMAEGRGCCGLPPVQSMPLPGSADEPEGICVCEFQEWYNLGQSKVSYHLRILKEAGLVIEEARGKWTFYSINKKTAREAIKLIETQLKL